MTSFTLLHLLLILDVMFGLSYFARPSQAACEDGDQVECINGFQCIYVWHVCDGEKDCWDASDENGCRTEPFTDNFLVVADTVRKNLFQVGIDESGIFPLLPFALKRPIAVVFDEETKVVYWTDVSEETINSYSLTSRSTIPRTLYRATSGTQSMLDGLALDAVHQTLFYCDAGDIGEVGSISTQGQHHRVLIKGVGMKPRSIVLDSSNRLMYWTDWGTDTAINKANMDTRGQYVSLVDDNLVWPNALAIDFSEEMMYWADAGLGTIETAHLDGTGRTVLYMENNAHYFNMQLTPEYIYFTDWRKRGVRKFNRQTYAVSNMPLHVFGKLGGITYCGQNDSLPSAATEKRTGSTTKRDLDSSSRASSGSATVPPTRHAPPKATRQAVVDDYDYANTETYVLPDNETATYRLITLRRNREL